jgi:hypothetical protein
MGEVINLFDRKKKKEEFSPSPGWEEAFKAIMEKNAENNKRIARERARLNQRTTREYGLRKK